MADTFFFFHYCTPQVDKSFDNEEPAAPGAPAGASRPPKAAAVAQRQRLWLQKKGAVSQTGRASFRPRKIYRAASKRFLRNVDNQFRVVTGSGLKQFQKTEEGDVWAPAQWRSWPFLGTALDQGLDNVCGVMALIYFFLCNVDFFPDPSHGANRDTWLALGKSCLRQFMLCMMVVWNCPFGPNEDEAWMNTLGECIKHIRQHFLPRDVPIWQDAAVEIERQLEAEGVELPGLDSSEVELFHYSLDSTFAARGARCNQARFQACIATCEKNLGHWHVDRTVRTAVVCCLSCL